MYTYVTHTCTIVQLYNFACMHTHTIISSFAEPNQRMQSCIIEKRPFSQTCCTYTCNWVWLLNSFFFLMLYCVSSSVGIKMDLLYQLRVYMVFQKWSFQYVPSSVHSAEYNYEHLCCGVFAGAWCMYNVRTYVCPHMPSCICITCSYMYVYMYMDAPTHAVCVCTKPYHVYVHQALITYVYIIYVCICFVCVWLM